MGRLSIMHEQHHLKKSNLQKYFKNNSYKMMVSPDIDQMKVN